MSSIQYRIVMLLGAVALALALLGVVLIPGNRSLQREMATRQQFVQESVRLEGLYREIVNALANLAARNNDEDVRRMLTKHGITYTVNPPAAANNAQPGQMAAPGASTKD